MPILKGKGCKAKPNRAIGYVTNPDKAAIITSQAMDDSRDYAEQFQETCAQYGKGSGFDERKYYHFKVSCDPADNASTEQSHALAEKLADELFNQHEFVIATHNDTNVVHSHIIVNAVNFENGKKLHTNNQEYAQFKDKANDLAVSMGLTQLDWRKATQEK